MIRINYDVLGISVSVACAIHCAVLPMVLTSLPIFGTNIIDHAGFELSMITLSAIVGMIALWHGYNKHHHRLLPGAIFITGIILLASRLLFKVNELYFLLPAVICIIWAHWLNYRLCRKANHCHADDCQHSPLK
jgi:hypothetical protein